MKELAFAFEWEEPQGARGEELRATWARLQILVGGQNVTRALDDRSRGVRDAVYLPLYPVAEWLATHWWLLAYEPEVPGRVGSASYETRHSLRYAGEGFALPDLSIRPVGGATRLVWQRLRRPAQHLEFLTSGVATVDGPAFRAAAGALIDGVRRRLRDQGVGPTLLDHEWDAIQNTDEAEQEFCAAAASLGVDPYALGDAERDAIVRANAQLPSAVATEFFDAADVGDLAAQAAEVATALRQAEAQERDRRFLLPLRASLANRQSPRTGADAAWTYGYDLAGQLRGQLGLNGQPLGDLPALARALGAEESHALDPVVGLLLPAYSPFDAVVAASEDRGPGFAVNARRGVTQRFAVCRALYEFFTSPDDAPRLVTRARTATQQSSRAFAAEFLAPVAALRARVRGPEVPDDEADELAAEFGVSALVVKHQLENHGAARVI